MSEHILMDGAAIARTLARLSHEIVEKNKGCENLCLVGIKRRGEIVAARLQALLRKFYDVEVPCAGIDIGLYRDDLEDLGSEVEFFGSEIDFSVDGKTVLICDDVLYTGRTVRAAISEVMALGRPAKIQLLALVDRGHRELPFKADFTGKSVPSSAKEGIAVRFTETDGEDGVYIYDK